MKITPQELDSLYHPDKITKSEYDRILCLVDSSFEEIVYKIKPSIKRKGWFDFSNCDTDAEESKGYFDPIKYKECIRISGEYCDLPEPYGYYIPTRWLYTDIEEVLKEFKTSVESEKKRKIEFELNKKRLIEERKLKVEKEEMDFIERIKKKLSVDELQFLNRLLKKSIK